MPVMSTMLSFESTAFPVEEGEDAETNPGIFGKSLAEWLAARLNERGTKANPPFAEDWGWCVELANQKYRTALACASEDNSKTAWRVYAFVEPGFLGSLRGKDASVSAVNDLIERVRDILSQERSITNIQSDET